LLFSFRREITAFCQTQACLPPPAAPQSSALTRANPPKGGDAKPPVYGHISMTAGSPVIQSGHIPGAATCAPSGGQTLTSDTSASAQSAVTDFGLWLYHGFFVPGDYVSSILSTHAPRVAQFLGPVGHGSVLSGLISAVVWLGAIALIVAAWKLVRDIDRALTAFIGRLYQELRRSGRIVARRLAIAFRSRALRRQARLAGTEVSEQPELTALELMVLQSHTKLAPGHLLTASEIASALKVRSTTHVQQALNRLRTLSLVHRTFGAGDGEDGYRLTRPGELFLAACNRAHPTRGKREAAASGASLASARSR
jgi:hypothetical protein